MKKQAFNKDSYLYSGALKATAAAVIGLLASSAHAGGFLGDMGRWLTETSASLQAADTAHSSDSGAPVGSKPLRSVAFDASSMKVSDATATNHPPAARTDSGCRDTGGSMNCIQAPTNDPAQSGLGGTSDGTSASGESSGGGLGAGALGGGRGGSDGNAASPGKGNSGNS